MDHLIVLTTAISLFLSPANRQFCPSRDPVPRSLPQPLNQLPLKCYQSTLWLYSIRWKALLSSVWVTLAPMRGKLCRRGDDEQNPAPFVFNIYTCQTNGLSVMKTAAMPIFPHVIVYLGRIERVSTPFGHIARSAAPSLIAAPIPEPLKCRQNLLSVIQRALPDTQTADGACQSLKYNIRGKITKVIEGTPSAWSSSIVIFSARDGVPAKFASGFETSSRVLTNTGAQSQ